MPSNTKQLNAILSGKKSIEQIDAILDQISTELSDYGECPRCGESDYPVDRDGNEIEGDDVSMASEFRERHDSDCDVTLIEKYRASLKKAVKRQTVTTSSPLSPEQSQALIGLGCEATPFMKRGNALLFAAQPTEAGVEALRALDFVESVVEMPVYGPC